MTNDNIYIQRATAEVIAQEAESSGISPSVVKAWFNSLPRRARKALIERELGYEVE